MPTQRGDAVLVRRHSDALDGSFGVVEQVKSDGTVAVRLPRRPGERAEVHLVLRPTQLRLLSSRRRRKGPAGHMRRKS